MKSELGHIYREPQVILQRAACGSRATAIELSNEAKMIVFKRKYEVVRLKNSNEKNPTKQKVTTYIGRVSQTVPL